MGGFLFKSLLKHMVFTLYRLSVLKIFLRHNQKSKCQKLNTFCEVKKKNRILLLIFSCSSLVFSTPSVHEFFKT